MRGQLRRVIRFLDVPAVQGHPGRPELFLHQVRLVLRHVSIQAYL